MTLQHIVLFSFPRELSEDEAEEMRAMAIFPCNSAAMIGSRASARE